MTVLENSICYLEIVTDDVSGARSSYEKVFGWRFEGPVPELGNAIVAALPAGGRCAIRAPMHTQEAPTVRTYIRVSDVEQAAETAKASGAMIALPPTELPGQGRIAIYILGGIEQGVWQLP